jgi:hypothetical protein
VIPAGTVIAAGDWLVVGQSALVVGVDVEAPGFSLGNATSSSDGARLVNCAGGVVDTVIYGSPNTDGWLDDSGLVAVGLAPSPGSGASIARTPNGQDTDDSGVDFVEAAAPTPGAENGGVVIGACDDAVVGASVVINELISDPDGSDTGLEWVELYNAGNSAVDVSGWAVVAGTSSFSGAGVLPEGTVLAPHDWLVVAQTGIPEADVVADGFSLGNASSNADGVRVEDCNGTPVDTVIYGTPNTDGWIDDSGLAATSLGLKPGSGQSLARITDGVDTDGSAVDFELADNPTPGSGNDAPVETCGGPGSGLVINELMYDPDGSDDGFEWIELYHAGDKAIDLSGWAIELGTSSFSPNYTFPEGATIAPGGRLLIGELAILDSDYFATLGMGNASSNADAVRIVDCTGFASDTVIYGEVNTDSFVDDSGEIATSLAPQVAGGSSLQRVSDGYDTDASAVDFAEQIAPTPGAPNPEIEALICVASTGDVVLNEFVPNPASSDTGAEWVELYNRGSAAADVSGWGIDIATSTWSDEPDVILPAGTVIEAGGWLVVGGSLAPEVDVQADLSIGNASSNADGIRLVDCTGAPVDTVLYGESNPDGLTDDAGSIVPSPIPGEAGSLARNEDGVDTDVPEDWVIRGAPTPGASNLFVETPGGSGDDTPGGCGGGPAQDDAPGGCSTSRTQQVNGALSLALLGLALRRRRR